MFCSCVPGFGKKRVRALWGSPLYPEDIGMYLLFSQRGWDAVFGLATVVVDGLNRIRREDERREEERSRRRKKRRRKKRRRKKRRRKK